MPRRKFLNLPLLLLKNGTPGFILHLLFRFNYLLSPMLVHGIDNSFTDNFITESANYVTKRYRPNLLLLYLLELDQKRHRYGAFSRRAQRALLNHDRRLGSIMAAAKQAGIFDETAFLVIGDHGHFNVRHRININVAFKEANLLKPGGKGKLLNWKVWANCKGGAAHIRLKDRKDNKLRAEVSRILEGLKEDPRLGIDNIYYRDELDSLRVSDSIDFMVEAKQGFCFGNRFDGKMIEPPGKKHKSVHGYHPELDGNAALLIAAGSGIRRGSILPKINHVDIAPTIAALLDFELHDTDGEVLHFLLEKTFDPPSSGGGSEQSTIGRSI
jgi:predicted AlkP superfamily pyrophosphatase or phosphodiesterase